MKVGDLVICHKLKNSSGNVGTIVAFNKKGEGGKDFVHVLIGGLIQVYMNFDIEIISKSKE